MEFNATFLATIISFIVFVFLMNKILYAPILNIMEERKNFINDNQTNIALIAKELSFYHPITKELLTFKIDLPKKYPYTLF